MSQTRAVLVCIGVLFGLFLQDARVVTAIEESEAKISTHITTHSKNACTGYTIPPCNSGSYNGTITGSLQTGYDLYVIVQDADSSAGIAGASFGIAYNNSSSQGLDIFSWNLCADVEFRGAPTGYAWPDSGAGNVISWNRDTDCQRTVPASQDSSRASAIVGVFYVYAYSGDVFSITSRTYAEFPDVTIADCVCEEYYVDDPSHVGKVGFGQNQEGHDPCY